MNRPRTESPDQSLAPGELSADSGDLTRVLPLDATLVLRLDLEGRINDASVDFLRFDGRGEAELLGENFESLAHPTMPSTVFRAMWGVLRSGRPWTGIVHNQTADRRGYWARLSAIPWALNGRTLAYVVTLQRALSHQIVSAESTFDADRNPLPRPDQTDAARSVSAALRRLTLGGIQPHSGIVFASAFLAAGWVGYATAGMWLTGLIAILAAGLGGGLFWYRERRRQAELAGVAVALERIGEGERDLMLALDRDDEWGGLLRQLQILQVRLALTTEYDSRWVSLQNLHAEEGLRAGQGAGQRGRESGSGVPLSSLDRLIENLDGGSGRIEEAMIRVERVMDGLTAYSETRRTASTQGQIQWNALLEQLAELLEQIKAECAQAQQTEAWLEALELAGFEARMLMANAGLDCAHARSGSPHAVDQTRKLARDLGVLRSRVTEWLSKRVLHTARLRDRCEVMQRAMQGERSRLVEAGGESVAAAGIHGSDADTEVAMAAVSTETTSEGLDAIFSHSVQTLCDIRQALRSELSERNTCLGDLEQIRSVLSEGVGNAAETSAMKGSSIKTEACVQPSHDTPSMRIHTSYPADDTPQVETAKVAQLRSIRSGVSTPVPKIRRVGARRTSLSDEWGGEPK